MVDAKVNSCYLVWLVLVVSLTSAAFGIALVSTDELQHNYGLKMGWTSTEREDNVTWLTVSSALGLMIGSLGSSSVVKIGRRRAILIASIVALVGGIM